ncbi:MAG TPA: hypothetical protein HA264_03780 [Methanolinea sp.]|nr:hypothetical protein [Methanolinea sp.]
MGLLPERKGSEPSLKAGEAVIAQESDCNGRQDPEKDLRYIEPCQASQHDHPLNCRELFCWFTPLLAARVAESDLDD